MKLRAEKTYKKEDGTGKVYHRPGHGLVFTGWAITSGPHYIESARYRTKGEATKRIKELLKN